MRKRLYQITTYTYDARGFIQDARSDSSLYWTADDAAKRAQELHTNHHSLQGQDPTSLKELILSLDPIPSDLHHDLYQSQNPTTTYSVTINQITSHLPSDSI